MADSKVTDLTEKTSPATTDLLYIVDSPGGSPSSKKATIANVGEAINPMTTAGDIIYGGASGVLTRLAVGTAGQTLRVNTGATAPEWAMPAEVVIQTITVGVGGGGIDFTSVPSTYTHLRIVYQARCDRASNAADELWIRFNNDSGNNYDRIELKGSNTTASAAVTAAAAGMRVGYVTAATATAAKASTGDILIANYKGTTFHKTVSARCAHLESETAGTAFAAFVHGGIWRSTTAISRVTLVTANAANFVEGSVATLYGMMG